MKRYITALIIVLASTTITNTFAQEIKWYSFEEAIALNEQQPRKIMIDLYTDWCGWCKVMDKQTFQNKEIVEIINEKYYAVKFNAESTDTIMFQGKAFVNSKQGSRPPHQLAVAIMNGRMSYPSVAFMDEDNKFITVVPGFQKAAEMEPLLQFISASLYETNTDYEAYKKSYKKKK